MKNNLDISKIIKIIEDQKNNKIYDYEFLTRVFSVDFQKYNSQLDTLQILNKQTVLDAGCGFGQWSLALSQYNNSVYSIDISQERVSFLEKVLKELEINNVVTRVSALEDLTQYQDFFDTIYCYGVLFLCEKWKIALLNFMKSVKKDGSIYIMLTGIGYYINLWINQKNQSETYNPREYAFKTMINTVCENKVYPSAATVINYEHLVQFVNQQGWRVEKMDLPDVFYERYYDSMDCVYWVRLYK